MFDSSSDIGRYDTPIHASVFGAYRVLAVDLHGSHL